MGFSAIGTAIGAVGTVTQMSSRARQASAQRAQIRASQKANEEMYALNQRRYAYARNEANLSYLREKVVTDEMHRNAVTNLSLAQAQQGIANTQQQMQQQRFSANLENQINQMLGQSANISTQAALQENQALAALAGQFGQAEQGGREFVQRMILSGQNPVAARQMMEDFMLQQIYNQQQTQEAVNTSNRVAGAQTDYLTATANTTEQYRQSVNKFLSGQQSVNQRFQRFVNDTMPSLLDVQYQRNVSQLEAAKQAQLYEIEQGMEADRIRFENNQQVSQAQMGGVTSGIGSGLAGLAGQVAPFILDAYVNRPQPSSVTNNFSFTGPSQFAAPSPAPTRPPGLGNINLPPSGVFQDPILNYYG